MRWPDEVRDPSHLAPPAVEVGDSEIDGAVELIDALTTDDLTQFHDEYRAAMEELVHAKAEHRQPRPASGATPEPEGQLVDLMAALNASVEQARASRGEDAGPATVHEMPKPKRATAKKAAAKKTTKKATATPGRKRRSA
jgi:DNA end-binding protein Ku